MTQQNKQTVEGNCRAKFCNINSKFLYMAQVSQLDIRFSFRKALYYKDFF